MKGRTSPTFIQYLPSPSSPKNMTNNMNETQKLPVSTQYVQKSKGKKTKPKPRLNKEIII